jgi:subtilisin-like proprotein convertase family protein
LKYAKPLLAFVLALGLVLSMAGESFAGKIWNTRDLSRKSVESPRRNTGGDCLDNHGGPDGYGYVYADNQGIDTVTYDWVELRGDATAHWLDFSNNPDDLVLPVTPGFVFGFYGGNYSTVNVSTNGNLQFVTNSDEYSNDCLPSIAITGPMVCVYWEDLHLDSGGVANGAASTVGYKSFSDHVVIEYDSVGRAGYGTSSYKFEVILWSDGRIKMQYNHMIFGTHAGLQTIGIQSGTGTTYLQYACGSAGHQPINNLAIVFYQGQVGTLNGMVRDGGGSPVSGATVTIDEIGARALSDATGAYAFPMALVGTYSLTAGRSGYSSQHATGVVVSQGQTTTQDFTILWAGEYIYTAADVPVVIPDLGSCTSTIHVDTNMTIADLDVLVNLTHTYVSDVRLVLSSPDGQEIMLRDSDRIYIGGADMTNTLFDDEAIPSIDSGTAPFTGSYRPHQPLSVENGQNVHGDWTLTISDLHAADSGNLLDWEIHVTPPQGVNDHPAAPEIGTFALLGNYPNPFNSATEIRYAITRNAPVKLVLFNMLGQEVRTLVNTSMPAGEHAVTWDGRDARGVNATSGLYLLRLESADHVSAGKVILLR